ncbi:MAG: hypothetical protein KDK64_04610 [Chlamydiia bacterium]|nr:hypothetical protein [Chlamydiia bacterium]
MNVRTVTVPHQKVPLHAERDQGSLFSLNTEHQQSNFLKLGRYVVLAASNLLPLAAGTLEVTSLQKSLNGGGAVEQLASGEETTDNLAAGIEEIRETLKDPTSTTDRIARTLLLQSAYALEKTDSLLYVMSNFGVPPDLAVNVVHGGGYLASFALAIKNYVGDDTAQDIQDEQAQQTLSTMKKARFGASASAAVVGFLTLFSASAALAALWAILALASCALSISTYFYEKSLKEDQDSPYKRITPPTIQYV